MVAPIILLGLAPFTAALANNGAVEGQALHRLEVVDVNQFRLEVEKTELKFHPTVQEIDDGGTSVEELLFQYTPVESFNTRLYDEERVQCPLIPDFGSKMISRAPVATFQSGFESGADIINWNLDITDYRGEIFRSLQGDGVPPETIAWDGRGDHKEILKPGFPYSFLFVIEDSGTNRYQYTGSTFALPQLSYKDGKNLRIEAAGYSLFHDNSGRPLPDADREVNRILREILSAPKRAIQVEVWSEKLETSRLRADWLARKLEKELLLAENQVATETHAFKGDPPGRDGLVRITLLKNGKKR
jgi:hypothetical protein